MQCPQCQAENPPQAKFCMECAAPLALKCSACGAELPATGEVLRRVRASGRAGSPPSSATPAPDAYTPHTSPSASSPPAAALEGERKQVTVLFADLKGSMELLADRDPEEARAHPRSRSSSG